MTLLDLPVIAYIGIAVSAAFFFLLYTVKYILGQSSGSGIMQEIAGSIQKGSATFLKREFKILALVLVVIASALLFVNYGEANI